MCHSENKTLISCFLHIFLTIDLSLPDGISYPPESCQNKEDISFLRVGAPCEQDNNHNDVEKGAQEEDGDSASVVDDGAKSIGHDGVAEAIGD